MPWPTPQDYNEAIQTPAITFSDPELRSGAPELTALGLPRPITGNFASVYRVRCGGTDWAVRCFWRDHADLAERYASISDYLEMVRLPYTAGFRFLPHGMRIRGTWYPILKMEWVEGLPLNEYVAGRLGDRSALRRLAVAWREMVEALERHSIAHGDLQHGNVLVLDGRLKLVDYDAMFVPALAGRASHELGHQNYQHLRRSGSDFSPAVDHFSSWLVYLSLVALAAESDLWTALNGGDECLILRKDDLERRHAESSALARLRLHANPEVRSVASCVTSFLDLRPCDVPRLAQLEELVSPAAGGPRFRLGRRHPADVTVPRGKAGPEWLQGAEGRLRPAVPGLSWRPARPSPWLSAAGLGAAAVPAALMRIAPGLEVAGAVLWLLVLNLLGLGAAYRRDPVGRELRALRRREREARRALARVRREVEMFRRREDRLEARHERLLIVAAKRKTAVRRREESDLAAVVQHFDPRLAKLTAGLRAVDEREQTELAEALEAIRCRHVDRCLRRRKLLWAALPDVTPAARVRLWIRGVRTAADVDGQRAGALAALTPAAAAALLRWQLESRDEARRTAPDSLPGRQHEAIRRRHERRRSSLQRRRSRLEAREATLRAVIETHYQRAVERIDAPVAARARCHAGRRASLRDAAAGIRQSEPLLHWRLSQARRAREQLPDAGFARYVMAVLSGGRAAASPRT